MFFLDEYIGTRAKNKFPIAFDIMLKGLYVPMQLDPQLWEDKPMTKVTINSGVYLKPVVVLIDRETMSTGEGIALGCTRNPRCKLVGLEGTSGSFGMTGDSVYLTPELGMTFPDGASLNSAKEIQLDSKKDTVTGRYEGGVAPTAPIPRSTPNLIKCAESCSRRGFLSGPNMWDADIAFKDFQLDEAIKVLIDMVAEREKQTVSAAAPFVMPSALLVSLLALWFTAAGPRLN